jgi:hypothetical protein
MSNDNTDCGCGPRLYEDVQTVAAEAPPILDSVITCADGALSGAGGRQGACSSHGGVSK